MKNILITGGSRGIGLEFTQQYLTRGHRLIVTSRHPGKSRELQELQNKYEDRITISQLDVSDAESRRQLYQYLSEEFQHLDLLINNAGIASGNEKFRYQFGELNQEDLCRCLLVNSVAQLMMTQQFFPLLENAMDPIVVNMSSNSGSITRKYDGGDTGYGYSASKAALNMMTKMLSHELRDSGVIVVVLHPGWVRTTMLHCENAPLEPAESIGGMIEVIDSLKMKDTGKFFDWKRNELPW